jgi:hypothetical protein
MTASRSDPAGSRARRAASPAADTWWVTILYAAVGATFFWAARYPRPYGLAVGLQAILPMLALAFMVRHGRLGGFDKNDRTPASKVAYAFLMPILALALRAMMDWQILEWGRFWIPFLAIGAALLAVILLFASDIRGKLMRTVLIAALCLAYSFGLLVHLNCYYDASWGTSYESTVRAHHVSRGGRGPTMFYLDVYPWLDRPEQHRVRASRTVYGEHADGGPVRIVVHGGRLGIPWYAVY